MPAAISPGNTAIDLGTGYVAEPMKLVLDKDGKLPEAQVDALNVTLREIVRALNGNISLGSDNTNDTSVRTNFIMTRVSRTRAGQLDGEWIDYNFVDAATVYTIPHRLGRVPIAFFYCTNGAGAVITGDLNLWTTTAFTAQSSVAAVIGRILVF